MQEYSSSKFSSISISQKIISKKFKSLLQNKQLKVFVLIAFLVAITLQNAVSQNTTSWPYSRYGIGEIIPRGSGWNKTLGGTGIGINTPYHLNITNPASYNAMQKRGPASGSSFIFEFGVSYKASNLETVDTTQSNNNFNFNYLNIGFPVTKWWAMGAGLTQLSTIGYEITSKFEIDNIGTNINEYNGSGGLNQVTLTNSFKIFKGLSIGINASYLFGPLEESSVINVSDDNYSSNLYQDKQTIVGDFYLNYGLQYSHLFKNKYLLTFGAVYDSKVDIDAYTTTKTIKQSYINGFSITDLLNDTTSVEDKIVLPSRLGVGLSLRTEKWLFAADYTQQNWNESKIFGEIDPVVKETNTTFSGGIEFLPKLLPLRYWQAIKYRIGGHYTNTGMEFDNEVIKDYGFSFGLGLPLKSSKTSINLGFEFGKKGTTDNNLIKENYALIRLNISFQDFWFHKRQIF